jgi:hypothetical protein
MASADSQQGSSFQEKRVCVMVKALGLFSGSCVIALLLLSASAHAGIVNGSFENASIGPWVVVGPGGQVTPSFDGVSPTDGVKMAIIDSDTGALPTFILDLVLSNGIGVGANYLASAFPNATEGSLLFQSFNLSPGESIVSFNWNFLTNEASRSFFNDFAFAHLISGGSLVDSATLDTFSFFPESGSIYGSRTGWNTVSFSGLSPGSYSLVFGVMDAVDQLFPSALLVDNIRAIPEPSSVALLGLASIGLIARRRRS